MVPLNSSSRAGNFWNTPSPSLESQLLSFFNLVWTTVLLKFHEYSFLVTSRRYHFAAYSVTFGVLKSSCPRLFAISVNFRNRGCVVDIFWVEQSMVNNFLFFCQMFLYSSPICWKMLLWWGIKVTLIYGY